MKADLIHMPPAEVAAILQDIEDLLKEWEGDLSRLHSLKRTLHQIWETPATADYVVFFHLALARIERALERLQANHRLARKEFKTWRWMDVTFEGKINLDAFFEGKKIRWSRPYALAAWAILQEKQTGEDDCNAFALAMAHNLVYGDSKPFLMGDEVQRQMETRLAVGSSLPLWKALGYLAAFSAFPLAKTLWDVFLVGLHPEKIPWVGVPTWHYTASVLRTFPDKRVEHRRGATVEDLKQAIDEGKVVIVAVGWEDNRAILQTVERGNLPRIGHYMVAVGYDSQNVYFLDPAESPPPPTTDNWLPKFYSWDYFLRHWNRENLFIEAGSMWSISDAEKP